LWIVGQIAAVEAARSGARGTSASYAFETESVWRTNITAGPAVILVRIDADAVASDLELGTVTGAVRASGADRAATCPTRRAPRGTSASKALPTFSIWRTHITTGPAVILVRPDADAVAGDLELGTVARAVRASGTNRADVPAGSAVIGVCCEVSANLAVTTNLGAGSANAKPVIAGSSEGATVCRYRRLASGGTLLGTTIKTFARWRRGWAEGARREDYTSDNVLQIRGPGVMPV
jgi:hypothetical protein